MTDIRKEAKDKSKPIVQWLCGLDVSADITEGVMRTLVDKIADQIEPLLGRIAELEKLMHPEEMMKHIDCQIKIKELETKIIFINKQNEALNALVRANSAMGQGDIDGFVADYPEIQELEAKNVELESKLEKITGALKLVAGCKQHELQSCPCHITTKEVLKEIEGG